MPFYRSLEALGIPGPERFHLDFEGPAMRAVSQVYPDAKLVGCDAHFKRAIRRNLQKHKLLEIMNTNLDLQNWHRRLWALSLIPEEDIISVWEEELVATIPFQEDRGEDETDDSEFENEDESFNHRLSNFFTYFEHTWIGYKHPRTGMRKSPKFAHSIFNKFNALINDEDTTTNRSESHNNQMKLNLPRQANVWAIIRHLKEEEGLAMKKLQEASLGIAPHQTDNSSRVVNRKNRRNQLKNLLLQYGSHSKSQFIELLVDFYNNNGLD